MKKVLVIMSASSLVRPLVQEYLKSQGRVFWVASTLEEGWELFDQNRADGLDLIVVDACVGQASIQPDSVDLVKLIRGAGMFTGPILVVSGSQDFADRLIAAGCNQRLSVSLPLKTLDEALGINQ